MRRHPMRGMKMTEPGWVYVLPECGADRSLIKLGRSVDPMERAKHFWGFIWPRPRSEYPTHFWAVEVENRQAAERAALQAMAPLRAFETHPGWPAKPMEPKWPPSEWNPSAGREREIDDIIAATSSRLETSRIQPNLDVVRRYLLQVDNPWHPRKAHSYKQTPEYADYEVRLSAYLLQHRLWQEETTRLKLACFSEHFRCSVQTAVEIVSLAINAQLKEVSYGD